MRKSISYKFEIVFEVVAGSAHHHIKFRKNGGNGLTERISVQALQTGDQAGMYGLNQVIHRPILPRPVGPRQVVFQNALISFVFQGRLGLPDIFLGVQKAQEKQPGQMINIFHHPIAVVIAAQDLADLPQVIGEGAHEFVRWLMSQDHSHMDKMKDCTCGNSASAEGASGTKGKSCCDHSALATANKSSETKSFGDSKDTSRTTHFCASKGIKSGDLRPGTCSRFHRS